MSKNNQENPDNPFAALDKKRFPKQRGQRTKPPDREKKKKLSQDAEAELFQQAMLKVKSKTDKADGRANALEDENLADVFQKAVDARIKPAKAVPALSAERKTVVQDVPDEDSNAFLAAVGDSRPLSGKGREIAPEPELNTPPPYPSKNPLQDLCDGKVEFALNCTDEFVEGHVLGLDLLTVAKLQARQYSPEAHIDLHGLNSEQAYANLVIFFRSSYHKGARTLLVITGRGKNSLHNIPILRNKIQHWLMQEPFRRVVLAFCTAKIEDGGSGALYVLLRKQRKNSGKVRWDTHPADLDLLL